MLEYPAGIMIQTNQRSCSLFKNALCDLLGINVPILLAPMGAGATSAEFAADVSLASREAPIEDNNKKAIADARSEVASKSDVINDHHPIPGTCCVPFAHRSWRNGSPNPSKPAARGSVPC
jgi:hypothetical protein